MRITSTIKYTLICLLMLFFNSKNSMAQERPKIGIVLSGGGAKGVAHIGALKVIEEADIPIDYICGTSMGAVIGALYAIGYDAHSLDSLVRAQNWTSLLFDKKTPEVLDLERKYTFSIPISTNKKLMMPSSITKGQNILNKFSTLTVGYHGNINFDSLPIPFSCVAGDLVGGKEIVIQKGDLPLAMRTSMAVPGFFEPVYRDSMVLVDGGIFNNFPVDVMRKMGADIIIGVDLSTKDLEEPHYSTAVDIIDRLAMLSGSQKYQQNKQLTDLYINPSLIGYKSTDFNPIAISKMIMKGETAARNQWDKLMKIKEMVGETHRKNIQTISRESTARLHIKDIKIEGLLTYNEDWFKDVAGLKEDTVLTLQKIEDGIADLKRTGIFTSLSYRILDGDQLVYYVTESHRSTFNAGININNEEIASVLLDTHLKLGINKNHNLSISSKINRSPWFDLNYFYRLSSTGFIGGEYRIHYNNFKLKNNGDNMGDIQFLYNHVEIYWGSTNSKDFQFKAGIQNDIFTNSSDLYKLYNQSYNARADSYSSCFADWNYHTLDNNTHPTKGILYNIHSACYMDNSAWKWNDAFGIVSINTKMAIPVNSRLTVQPEFSGRLLQAENDVSPIYYKNFIGNEWANQHTFSQMPIHGIHFTEIAEDLIMDSTIQLQYNFIQKHYLMLSGSYIYNTKSIDDFSEGISSYDIALKYMYDSFAGPIKVSLDYSNYTKKIGFYISIGHSF